MLEHAMDRGSVNPGLAVGGIPLVIELEAPAPRKPAPATFSDPAALLTSRLNRSRCWAMRSLLPSKPTLANPVRHRSPMQLAQPVLLGRVGPDDPTPQA